MSPELDDFKQKILQHAKVVVARSPRVESEASTNTSLVQPFLTTLGYDVSNPDEVSPEHHADFSEKYQNNVDYAILHKGAPVIAIESKRVGAALKDDRGQLRSYFNASPTVKLGILTDGLRYEFYADSDKPNMMDENAFLRLNFAEIAKDNSLDDNTLSGIAGIRSGLFNPENVGAEAKLKLLFESIVLILKKLKSDPSDDFVRFILAQSELGSKFGKLTQKIVDTNRDVIRSAMEAFVAQEALARLGYAPKDVVRTPAEAATVTPISLHVEPEVDVVQPTTNELAALQYIKNRLFFLIRNDALFSEVSKISFRKSKSSFRVFYGPPNNGSLFDYREQKDGKTILHFPALGGKEVAYSPSSEMDECLLKSFSSRVKDAGFSVDGAPQLRAIQGGQAEGAKKIGTACAFTPAAPHRP